LITFERVSTAFDERAAQIRVLRAVGLRAGVVCRALVGESVVVGAAGVALGIPLAVVLGRLLVRVIASAGLVSGSVAAPPVTCAAEPRALLTTGGLGLATAVLAIAIPALRAVRGVVAATIPGCDTGGTGPAGPALGAVLGRLFGAGG